MARRRKHRRARENPLSDTTTLVLYGLGAVAVVGVGYLAYKKWGGQTATAGAQQFAPQLGTDASRNTPPPGANTGSSAQTNNQQQQQLQVFKLGDVGNAQNANPNQPPPQQQVATQAMSFAQAMKPTPTVDSVHGYRHTTGGGGVGDSDPQGYLNPPSP